MKLLLTTLNSKFIHSSLSIRYLEEMVKDIIDTEIMEFTINQSLDHILAEIHRLEVDIIGFSTYIWNFQETLRIAESIKLVRPDIKIFLGGPEVSYDGEELLSKYPYIDFIIYGEGELTLREFIEKELAGKNYSEIKGLIYREGEEIIKNPPRPLIDDLSIIPSPYLDRDIGKELENRIIYFESSRGCPFNCKFCLSSTIKGLRFFPLERVKEELGLLIDWNVRQVKFVDRSFNADKAYAMEVMKFIMEKNPKDINFHFEVMAHLIDEDLLEFISKAPEGLFQFEVGVQTTNEKTIKAIGRRTNFEKLREVTKKIVSYKNIHQHLDLIAGLPYEDYESFEKSFNQVYEIRPEKIQLGFLKILKGSLLEKEIDLHGFKYIDYPPYEVIETNYMPYKDMLRLKRVEEMVEKYYNEEYFKKTLDYIINNHYQSPFKFYQELGDYFFDNGYNQVSHSRRKLYTILKRFAEEKIDIDKDLLNELVKLDFYMNNQGGNLPIELEDYRLDIDKNLIHDFLRDEENIEKYFYDYKDLRPGLILRKIGFGKFKNYKGLTYYDSKRAEGDFIHLLFVYTDRVINRVRVYNVEDKLEEMIS